MRKREEDTVAESTDVQAPAAAADAAPGGTAGEHVSEYTTETGDATAGAPTSIETVHNERIS